MLAALRPSSLFTAAVIATSGLALGCSGPAFTNSGKGGDGGVPSSNAGANSGGGGRSGGNGGTSGAPAAGGASGASSSGGARTGGASGALGTSFPSTTVLDDFARADDDLGAAWRGATDEFALRDERLLDTTGAGQPLLWNERFGANQEVFATLKSFAEEASEINLVMKAQEPGNSCKLIEVLYQPNRSQVGVDFCLNVNVWTELPTFSVTLEPGDQLGARATANGKVTVYRNGELITTFDTSGFPYQAGGHIGVNALSIPEDPATWDDFGGGNTAP